VRRRGIASRRSCSASRSSSPKAPAGDINSPCLRDPRYPALIKDLSGLLESSARAVNALMTATYWEAGRRIAEYEQGGSKRAAYGKELPEIHYVHLLRRTDSAETRRFYRFAPGSSSAPTAASTGSDGPEDGTHRRGLEAPSGHPEMI
jgi:hypothetical protein